MTSPALLVYGKPDCADYSRSKALLAALGVDHDFVNVLEDADAASSAAQLSGGVATPVIVFSDGSHVVEPSNEELAAKLGLAVPEGHTSDEVCAV